MAEFVKIPCKHCPFRKDVKPFLHPKRGEELAFHVQNPYNTFPCHKTTEYDEEANEGEGDMVVTEDSLECAGFLTLRAVELGEDTCPEGFVPSYDLVYSDSWDMVDAYENPDEHGCH